MRCALRVEAPCLPGPNILTDGAYGTSTLTRDTLVADPAASTAGPAASRGRISMPKSERTEPSGLREQTGLPELSADATDSSRDQTSNTTHNDHAEHLPPANLGSAPILASAPRSQGRDCASQLATQPRVLTEGSSLVVSDREAA